MATLPADIVQQLQRFQQALQSLAESVQALSKSSSLQTGAASKTEQTEKQAPLDRAMTAMAVAETVHELWCSYLRCHGQDPSTDTDCKREADRLKQYHSKVTKANAAYELSQHRPGFNLNVAAASRFINQAIPDLDASQRAKLKEVADKFNTAQAAKERDSRQQQQQHPNNASSAGTASQQKQPHFSGSVASSERQKRQRTNQPREVVSAKEAAAAFLQSVAEQRQQELAEDAAADKLDESDGASG